MWATHAMWLLMNIGASFAQEHIAMKRKPSLIPIGVTTANTAIQSLRGVVRKSTYGATVATVLGSLVLAKEKNLSTVGVLHAVLMRASWLLGP